MKKNKFNVIKIIIIFVLIIIGLLLSLFLYDRFSDKTKIFNKTVNLTRDEIKEILKIYDNVPNISFTNKFDLSANLTKDNAAYFDVDINGDGNDGLYQLDLKNKLTNEDAFLFIQDENLYFKSDTLFNNSYILAYDSDSECGASVCPSNLGKYIIKTLNGYNIDDFKVSNEVIDELAGIINSSLDNQYITKKRTFVNVDNKKKFYAKYSYKLNNDSLNILKDNILKSDTFKDYFKLVETGLSENLEVNAEFNVYAFFGSVRKIDITLGTQSIEIVVNKNKIKINYKNDNINKIINVTNGNIEYTSYVDDEKVINLNLKDNKDLNITYYKDEKEYSYNIGFTKKNINNIQEGTISLEYMGNVYIINYTITLDSAIEKQDVSASKNYKEMSAEEISNMNTAVENLKHNEFINIIMNLLMLNN